jgi:hypothetical protein
MTRHFVWAASLLAALVCATNASAGPLRIEVQFASDFDDFFNTAAAVEKSHSNNSFTYDNGGSVGNLSYTYEATSNNAGTGTSPGRLTLNTTFSANFILTSGPVLITLFQQFDDLTQTDLNLFGDLTARSLVFAAPGATATFRGFIAKGEGDAGGSEMSGTQLTDLHIATNPDGSVNGEFSNGVAVDANYEYWLGAQILVTGTFGSVSADGVSQISDTALPSPVVPEPGTMTLWAIGGILALAGRRKLRGAVA